jgi:hypothetical protein
MSIRENIRKASDPYLTASQNVYNGKHEPHSYPTHQGRPDTYGLAYLTPAKVRSPTGRDSIFHNSIPCRGHTPKQPQSW